MYNVQSYLKMFGFKVVNLYNCDYFETKIKCIDIFDHPVGDITLLTDNSKLIFLSAVVLPGSAIVYFPLFSVILIYYVL